MHQFFWQASKPNQEWSSFYWIHLRICCWHILRKDSLTNWCPKHELFSSSCSEKLPRSLTIRDTFLPVKTPPLKIAAGWDQRCTGPRRTKRRLQTTDISLSLWRSWNRWCLCMIASTWCEIVLAWLGVAQKYKKWRFYFKMQVNTGGKFMWYVCWIDKRIAHPALL